MSDLLSRAYDLIEPACNYVAREDGVDRWGQFARPDEAIAWSVNGAIRFIHGRTAGATPALLAEAYAKVVEAACLVCVDTSSVWWSHREALMVLGQAYRLALAEEQLERAP